MSISAQPGNGIIRIHLVPGEETRLRGCNIRAEDGRIHVDPYVPVRYRMQSPTDKARFIPNRSHIYLTVGGQNICYQLIIQEE